MKRRFASIACVCLCAALLCLSLAACGSAASDGEIYEKCSAAETKTNAVTRYSAGVTIRLDAAQKNGTSKDKISSVATLVADLDASVCSQKISNDFNGTKVENEVYYEGGYQYYVTPDGSFKYAVDETSAMSGARSVAAFGFTQKWFDGAAIAENGDGSFTVTTRVPASEVEDMCSSYLALFDNYTGAQSTFDRSDADVTVKVDADGYIGGVTLDFTADAENANYGAASISVSVKIEYFDLTGAASPTPPDGYLDFPTYDEFSASSGDGSGDSADSGDDTASAGDDEEFLSEEDAAAIDAAFELFEDDHVTPVVGYAEKYAAACEKYGKDTIDSIIAVIQMFGSVNNN